MIWGAMSYQNKCFDQTSFPFRSFLKSTSNGEQQQKGESKEKGNDKAKDVKNRRKECLSFFFFFLQKMTFKLKKERYKNSDG